jgi:hypothetical protein
VTFTVIHKGHKLDIRILADNGGTHLSVPCEELGKTLVLRIGRDGDRKIIYLRPETVEPYRAVTTGGVAAVMSRGDWVTAERVGGSAAGAFELEVG